MPAVVGYDGMEQIPDGDKTVVVELRPIKDEAYRMGHERFSDLDDFDEDIDPMMIHESAHWANVMLPKIRRMAGYRDWTGKGTYTGERSVAAVLPGYEDDERPRVRITPASEVKDQLFDSFFEGAHDALIDVASNV